MSGVRGVVEESAMLVELRLNAGCAGDSAVFAKVIKMPCAPFVGLKIVEDQDAKRGYIVEVKDVSFVLASKSFVCQVMDLDPIPGPWANIEKDYFNRSWSRIWAGSAIDQPVSGMAAGRG